MDLFNAIYNELLNRDVIITKQILSLTPFSVLWER